jgi:cytosine/adenosine deaminase-related metal-dependent hydrolase
MMDFDLIIRQAYIRKQDKILDIGVVKDRIAKISEHIEAKAEEEINANGKFISPGFIDPHTHMDKSMTCTGDRFPKYNDSRDTEHRESIKKRIEAGLKYYSEATIEEVKSHTIQHAYMCIKNGTLFVRTFVDVDKVARLKAIEGVLAARDELRDLIDIKVVAMAQSGFLNDRESEPLVRKAIEMGAELVGSLDPATCEGNIEEALDLLFKIAKDYNVGIDNHIMDIGTLGLYTLERQAKKTIENDYIGRVTASHSFCLGDAPVGWIDRAIPKFKEADMRFVTCYKSSPYKMPVKKLLSAGITVAIASDNVRDFWRAYGNADLVQGALIEMHRLEMNTNPDLDLLWNMITTEGAKVLGVEKDYGIEEGKKADLVILDALSPQWAIIDQAKKLYVIKNGKIIVKNEEILPKFKKYDLDN